MATRTRATSTAESETTPRRRTRKTEPESPKWTIVSALDSVLSKAHNSRMQPEMWEDMEEEQAFLQEQLGLTAMQIIVIAMLIDSGSSLSWKNFAHYIGCSRLKVLVYSEEIDELIDKRWIWSKHGRDEEVEFALAAGVVDAIRKNQVYVPENVEGLTEKQFYDKIHKHIHLAVNDYHHNFEDEEECIMRLCEVNPQLPVVKMMNQLGNNIHERMLWMMIVDDYIVWNNTPDEGLLYETVQDNFPDCFLVTCVIESMRDGVNILYKLGFVEMKCDEGLADNERYMLTSETKARLFPDSSLLKKPRTNRRQSANDLKKAKSIKEKTLFYNPAEGEKVGKLVKLLSQEQFPLVQQRLEEQGLRKGFACLFYGSPGVGKTESVYQIARMTGRDIMQVNIAGMKNKYVGESEKNIKQVFTRYRQICKESKVMPILLFNEADAIINKRSTNTESAVDKMDNAMQNIILQEMEDLEGILIATTNLTDNFDHAFERRFLFKVEFHKPSVDVKEKIWSSMVSEITVEQAHELAKRYDLSPGQIENVARKKTIDYIINGEQPTLERLSAYCRDEQLANSKRPQHVSGFSA